MDDAPMQWPEEPPATPRPSSTRSNTITSVVVAALLVGGLATFFGVKAYLDHRASERYIDDLTIALQGGTPPSLQVKEPTSADEVAARDACRDTIAPQSGASVVTFTAVKPKDGGWTMLATAEGAPDGVRLWDCTATPWNGTFAAEAEPFG